MFSKEKSLLVVIFMLVLQSQTPLTAGSGKRDVRSRTEISPGTLQTIPSKIQHTDNNTFRRPGPRNQVERPNRRPEFNSEQEYPTSLKPPTPPRRLDRSNSTKLQLGIGFSPSTKQTDSTLQTSPKQNPPPKRLDRSDSTKLQLGISVASPSTKLQTDSAKIFDQPKNSTSPQRRLENHQPRMHPKIQFKDIKKNFAMVSLGSSTESNNMKPNKTMQNQRLQHQTLPQLQGPSHSTFNGMASQQQGSLLPGTTHTPNTQSIPSRSTSQQQGSPQKGSTQRVPNTPSLPSRSTSQQQASPQKKSTHTVPNTLSLPTRSTSQQQGSPQKGQTQRVPNTMSLPSRSTSQQQGSPQKGPTPRVPNTQSIPSKNTTTGIPSHHKDLLSQYRESAQLQHIFSRSTSRQQGSPQKRQTSRVPNTQSIPSKSTITGIPSHHKDLLSQYKESAQLQRIFPTKPITAEKSIPSKPQDLLSQYPTNNQITPSECPSGNRHQWSRHQQRPSQQDSNSEGIFGEQSPSMSLSSTRSSVWGKEPKPVGPLSKDLYGKKGAYFIVRDLEGRSLLHTLKTKSEKQGILNAFNNFVEQSWEEIQTLKRGDKIATYATEVYDLWQADKVDSRIMTEELLKHKKEGKPDDYNAYLHEMERVCIINLKTYFGEGFSTQYLFRDPNSSICRSKRARIRCDVTFEGKTIHLYLSKKLLRTKQAYFVRVLAKAGAFNQQEKVKSNFLPVEVFYVDSGMIDVGLLPKAYNYRRSTRK